MTEVERAALTTRLDAQLPALADGALDIVLDGEMHPVDGFCTNPFIIGDLDTEFRLRPAKARIGGTSAPTALYWLLPPGLSPVVVPDRILAHIVATIDAGRSAVICGMDESAIASVRTALVPLCGGGRSPGFGTAAAKRPLPPPRSPDG